MYEQKESFNNERMVKMKKNRIMAAVSAFVMAAACMGTVWSDRAFTTAAESTEKKSYKGKVVYGDIDMDGQVNVTDLTILSLHLLGDLTIREEAALEAANVLYDDAVDLLDLPTLKQFIAKRITEIGCTDEEPYRPEVLSISEIGEKIGAEGYMEFVCNTTADVLFKTEDKNSVNNPVYSPASFYTALSMTAECAAGNTRDEMVKALCADDMEDLRAENRVVYRAVNDDHGYAYCRSSNSVWLNDIYQYEQSALDQLSSRYHAKSFEKDFFAAEQTEKEISDWIYENTDYKIKPEIKIYRQDPAHDIAKIINTVVFKDAWTEPFYNVHDSTFHTADGKNVTASFMVCKDRCEAVAVDNYTLCKKNLKEGYSMLFVLPDEGTDIKDIISDSDKFAEILGMNTKDCSQSVELIMPEFDVASKFDLAEVSEKIGIEIEKSGDFTSLINYGKNGIPGAQIDAVNQETVLKVDKDGCEGATYTIVEIGTIAPTSTPGKSLTIKLDRPFFYCITNQNDIPLFAGIIDNPIKK